MTSIQSFPLDGKTPTAETFSPICERPKIVRQIPAPNQSDFQQNEVDPYSELCTQQLDSLDNLEEELENDSVVSSKEKTIVMKPQKLQPLDLKKNEPKQPPQKLTTPGEYITNYFRNLVKYCLPTHLHLLYVYCTNIIPATC